MALFVNLPNGKTIMVSIEKALNMDFQEEIAKNSGFYADDFVMETLSGSELEYEDILKYDSVEGFEELDLNEDI